MVINRLMPVFLHHFSLQFAKLFVFFPIVGQGKGKVNFLPVLFHNSSWRPDDGAVSGDISVDDDSFRADEDVVSDSDRP